MNNHLEVGDLQEENTESEIPDDDVIIENDDLNLMNVSPPYGELGREMRQLGLNNNELHVQVHPTRLLINPEHPLYNPTDVDLHIEDWAGYDLMRLPPTSAVSCG